MHCTVSGKLPLTSYFGTYRSCFSVCSACGQLEEVMSASILFSSGRATYSLSFHTLWPLYHTITDWMKRPAARPMALQ
jgi:hypothetical protein